MCTLTVGELQYICCILSGVTLTIRDRSRLILLRAWHMPLDKSHLAMNSSNSFGDLERPRVKRETGVQ